MQCPVCKTELEENAAFCGECGSSTTVVPMSIDIVCAMGCSTNVASSQYEEEYEERTDDRKSRRNLKILCVVGVALLLLIVGSIVHRMYVTSDSYLISEAEKALKQGHYTGVIALLEDVDTNKADQFRTKAILAMLDPTQYTGEYQGKYLQLRSLAERYQLIEVMDRCTLYQSGAYCLAGRYDKAEAILSEIQCASSAGAVTEMRASIKIIKAVEKYKSLSTDRKYMPSGDNDTLYQKADALMQQWGSLIQPWTRQSVHNSLPPMVDAKIDAYVAAADRWYSTYENEYHDHNAEYYEALCAYLDAVLL